MSTRLKFEYEWRDTIFHRMHPITKGVIGGCLTGIISNWLDPRYIFIGFLIALVMYYTGKVPMKWFIIFILFTIGWVPRDIIFKLPFYNDPAIYKVLDPDYATTVLWDFGDVPFLNIHASYTMGSIWLGVSIILKQFTLVMLVAWLYYTVSIANLLQVLLKLRTPHILVFNLMVAYRFSPIIVRGGSDIVNAQKLRGWKKPGRNPLAFVKIMLPMVYPLIIQFMRSVDMVTLGVVNRAFGANPMKPFKILKWPLYEKILCIIMILLYLALWYLVLNPPYFGNI